jgi:2-desacetyl-2-hydroxyethyl bacteriochlorophyllide A dehydrogenase
VSIVERAAQRAGPGEALVRLRLGGICGSDLSAYRGTSPMVSYPRVLGHELLVDVLECADRPEIEGQRAVVEPLIRCGRCRACRVGRYNCCVNLRTMGVHVDGGLQDTFAVDSRQVYPIPFDMPDEVAVLAEPLTVAYHTVQRAEIDAGRIALVFGAGAIGLLIARLLVRARGCRALVADVDEHRLGIAAALGAIPAQGDREALIRQVAEATGGEMADVVFEATGNAACTRMTTDLVAHAGRIVLVGWNKGPVEVDTVTLMRKEVDLLGSRNSANAFPPVLRLLADGLIDADALITHRFQLTEADAALGLLDGGDDHTLKILLARE